MSRRTSTEISSQDIIGSRRPSQPETESSNHARINTRINRDRRAQILHTERENIRDDGVEKKPSQDSPPMSEELMAQNQKYAQRELDHKTKLFHKYYQDKSKKIFQPDEYQREIAGQIPTESPLLAALHASGQRSSYLTPLPAMAYRRQIDVDSKYIREGRYIYGAQ